MELKEIGSGLRFKGLRVRLLDEKCKIQGHGLELKVYGLVFRLEAQKYTI
jgi:hypothetical protein